MSFTGRYSIDDNDDDDETNPWKDLSVRVEIKRTATTNILVFDSIDQELMIKNYSLILTVKSFLRIHFANCTQFLRPVDNFIIIFEKQQINFRNKQITCKFKMYTWEQLNAQQLTVSRVLTVLTNNIASNSFSLIMWCYI